MYRLPIGVILSCVLLLSFGGGRFVRPAFGEVLRGGQDAEAPAGKGGDVDETVSFPMDQVLAAAKQGLLIYGCDVNAKKEKPDYLECTRSRHVGAFVGSGGEKITVRLSPSGADTRVVIKTGKGFVGRLGKRNWSRQIFEEMTKSLRS